MSQLSIQNPLSAGDELLAALRQYARDRATTASPEDSADVEMAILQLQKLAAIGELATDIAHDFGNLTTVMLGYTDLLLAAAEDGQPPDREYLEELRRAAERASTLTTRLLVYSRRPTDDAVPLDLGQTASGLTPMLRRLLGSRARLVVHADPSAGTVLADVQQIEQLVINLVLNSRDAVTLGGQVELAIEPVRLERPLAHALGTAPPGDYVRLRVHDDGHGMGPETLERLFRPFLTGKEGGAGLGLTIAARVIHKANAAVTVESAIGAGTTVDVYFPRWSGMGQQLE
ncbi:MAG TPA: ATP-binding protein [Gemmataceae bacterium]|jgi:two-component system cell cycle sensor histidine kinase/response regulator CckA|nr:ATP-binding protein [Gemmataceae bacterium]